MNRTIPGILIGLVLGAAGAVLYLRYVPAKQERATEQPTEESLLPQNEEGGMLVTLDSDTQMRMGLKVEPLAAVQMSPEVKGYGRVLDPGPLASLVTEAASAQASLEASTKEFERVKALYSQNQNVSARALETAEATLRRDQIALASVQSRLLLDWGPAIASQPDLPAFVRSLVAGEASLVRVDVPPGEPLPAAPAGGRVAPLAAPERRTAAQYLSPAPRADPQSQGRGLLLLVKADGLPPGTSVLAMLTVPGQPRSGVVVPRGAILRYEGGTFVYLQTADDVFERKAVTIEQPAGDGWFVGQGFQPQDKVIVVGAQELLSEELKGQGGDE